MGYTKVCNQPQPPTTTQKLPKNPQLVINSHVTALRC